MLHIPDYHLRTNQLLFAPCAFLHCYLQVELTINISEFCPVLSTTFNESFLSSKEVHHS